jgi:hypothetical protein
LEAHATIEDTVARFEPVPGLTEFIRPSEPVKLCEVLVDLVQPLLELGDGEEQRPCLDLGFPWRLSSDFLFSFFWAPCGVEGGCRSTYEAFTLPNDLEVYVEFCKYREARLLAASRLRTSDDSDRRFAQALFASNGKRFGTTVIRGLPTSIARGLEVSQGRWVDLVLDLFGVAEHQHGGVWERLLVCRDREPGAEILGNAPDIEPDGEEYRRRVITWYLGRMGHSSIN